MSRRDAYTIAKAAKLLRRPELADAADSVLTADVDLGTAVVVGGEFDKLAPDLTGRGQTGGAGPAAGHGRRRTARRGSAPSSRKSWPGGVRTASSRNTRTKCRRQIDLSPGRETSPGVWDYRLTTDNEGRAVLEAAIGPLSAPRVAKDADGRSVGEPDTRTAGRRRGEALIEALRRSVTVTDPGPADATGNPKAVLMLTLDFDDLAAQYGAARVLGTVGRGRPARL